ncbi:ATPase family associated with various cellular activities (AAA) [Rubripirellula obstinata]|uniref:ATPase family associated with various cellular activities (AAA) n=1 Tax=Rubripirellula obstinata TaxID=406547 RepID=A0A5B1CD44_9BACT|nr:MoxR family ATPase [Rubripirellula obstinata]KAA1257875.1 ATPase family associated with various cellular activities (AAA) [Rubripirellula obstinata]
MNHPTDSSPAPPPHSANSTQSTQSTEATQQEVLQCREAYDQLRQQLGLVIVGMEPMIEQLMIGMLCRGHCILQGMPGLAKTLLISSLAKLIDMSFARIQFTPDLMPADITGGEVLEEDRTTGKRVFRFVQGPVFHHLVLADEINRTPPKSQSALLEAMEERQLTVAGTTYELPNPFFVLATQNPIEVEGTYPLPEAQLDRFLLKILVEYPERDQEIEICRRQTSAAAVEMKPVMTTDSLRSMQALARRILVADHVMEAAVDLARMTRPGDSKMPAEIAPYVQYGGGPRASLALIKAAKARALLNGRHHATTEDVCAVARPVFRHRMVLTFNAETDGVDIEALLDRLIQSVSGANVNGRV